MKIGNKCAEDLSEGGVCKECVCVFILGDSNLTFSLFVDEHFFLISYTDLL